MGNLTAEKNRIQKVLECSNIKLGTVISDVFGTSGRKLLTRLVEQGYVDPSDVNDCIHGSLKKKAKSISESLFGTLNEHQIFLIRKSWNHIVFLEKSIQELEERIDELLEPYLAKHLSSWAGVSPGNHESAGKKKYENTKREPTYKNNVM